MIKGRPFGRPFTFASNLPPADLSSAGGFFLEEKMFRSDDEVIELVRNLESCELPPSEFRHSRHLAVGAFYVCEFGPMLARDKMRETLLRYVRYLGKEDKYNEQLTMDWMDRIAVVVAVTTARTLHGKVNAVIEHYAPVATG